MTLSNDANLQDVSSVLSEMQGINQKAELASVIGSPVQATDPIASQIVKLQASKTKLADKVGMDASLPIDDIVDAVKLGKGVATGEITPTTSLFDITGLDFEPSKVMYYQTAYDVGISGVIGIATKEANIHAPNSPTTSNLMYGFISAMNYNMTHGTPVFSGNNVYNLVIWKGSSIKYRWYAFE